MSTLSSLDVSYDPWQDVLTVEGVRYSGTLFREFASLLPIGQPFKIDERREDGLLVVTRLTGEKNDTSSE